MELRRLDPNDPRPEFSCGDSDIDEFFSADSIVGGRELMSVTYAFFEGEAVLGFFSVSNDSIKKEHCPGSAFKRLQRIIPQRKRYSSMPTAKIGRIGVCVAGKRSGLGTKILDYLKYSFTHNNKTGCRFLVVDAYNQDHIIAFYRKNGFEFLTGADEAEETRIMYFDLITFAP